MPSSTKPPRASAPPLAPPAAAPAAAPHNIPEFSVSDLSTALKLTLEERFSLVRVRGEISNFKGPHSSGHCYFRLKDSNALLEAVIWKGVYTRLRIKPQEGMEVVATGKITTFAGKSSYQLIIETLEPAGIGALMALLEERRQRLLQAGVFDQDRKRKLPRYPKVIGVITSPTGAVIRDILHRLNERWPCHVLVWPVRVQGEGSAEEVTRAICGFNALPAGMPRPDVLIVARGGGSLEDLWGFNEEAVVMAASESAIPLISAVGHETDTTLIDFAADQRAPTPTAAAEMATPVRANLLLEVATLALRLTQRLREAHEQRALRLASLARALPAPQNLLTTPRQKLDFAEASLRHGVAQTLNAARRRVNTAANRLTLQSPLARLARMRTVLAAQTHQLQAARLAISTQAQNRFALAAQRLQLARQNFTAWRGQAIKNLSTFSQRLGLAEQQFFARQRDRLTAQAQLLASLGYKNVLARGYAVVRAQSGDLLASASAARGHAHVNLEFCDGILPATLALDSAPTPQAAKTDIPKPAEKPVAKPKPPSGDQGSFF